MGDDPIIQKIPVYLSKRLIDQLYIFNYHIEGPRIDIETKLHANQCKFKPKHQEVLLETSLKVNNPNYDVSKGEEIVINCDGHDLSKFDSKNTEDSYFSGNLMDKIVLKGNKSTSDNNYAIALFDEGELHITPLQGIINLKPSLDYLDKTDKHLETKDNNNIVNSEEEDEEVKQVTVKFARQDNEYFKKAREKSFGYLSKKNAEEQWYNVDFFKSTSDRIELEHQKLYCSQKEEEVHHCINKSDFINMIFPNTNSDDIEPTIPPISSSDRSYKNLKKLNLVEQLKIIFKRSYISNFETILKFIGTSFNKDEIIRAIQQVAVLVQGNWIVQSELVYPKESTSKINGISSLHMIQARDFILYQFTQNNVVNRTQICAVVKIPSEEVLEILEQFAFINENKDWQLINPCDKDFVKRYGDVVNRQYNWLEAKYKQIILSLESNNTSNRQRRKSHRESSVSSDDFNSSNRKTQKKKIKQEPKSES